MQKVGNLRGGWRNVAFFLIALLVVVADQLSKLWIRSNLLVGQSLPEEGFLQLTHVRNTGASFGLFQDQSFTLTIVAMVGIALILVYALIIHHRFFPSDNLLGKSALGLILGGTIGNLIDRLNFGYITDFIDIGIWPAFNIADSSIVVGVILFAYSLLPLARAEKH